ncbi:MAG: hypothetical protein OJI67_01695, partial [Prosthecobacter sp.]|nr:hypothetical protein [Prosthecobacter sp.]
KDAVKEQLRALADQITERQQVIAEHHPRVMLSEASHRVENQAQQMKQLLNHRLARVTDLVAARAAVIKNLGPQSILSRGFSYTTDEQGKVIKTAEELKPGQTLVTRLQKGRVISTVK